MELLVSRTFDKISDAYYRLKIRYIVSRGGSRSGKTYSTMQLFFLILCSRKKIKITCWRNLRIDAIETMLEDFKSVLDSHPSFWNMFVFNKKEAQFTHKKTGSVILFNGTEVISKALGRTQHISFFNEISEFNEAVFDQIVQRTRDTVFIDYNPSKSFFIDKYEKNDQATFLYSTYKDNIDFLTPDIVAKLESYNPFEVGSTYVSEDFVLMYKGLPVTAKNVPPPHPINVPNGTANLYKYEVYCLGLKSEKPNRVYRDWKKCTDDFYHSLEFETYFGLDFGVSKPTAIVEVKFDGDRTFYVHQRLYKPSQEMGMPIYEWCLTMMNPPIPKDKLVVADSAKASMVQDLRTGGLMAVDAIKGQGSLQKRITAVQSVNIVYTESSKDLENEYYEYSYKIDRYGLVTDEIDPRSEDHLLDATGYDIDYIMRYLGIVFN
jgi:phage terminase large subunit